MGQRFIKKVVPGEITKGTRVSRTGKRRKPVKVHKSHRELALTSLCREALELQLRL